MHWRAKTRFLPSPTAFFTWLHRRWNLGSSPREVKLILAYGLTAFPIAIINNIWVTYNYTSFVSGILADSPLFILVQVIFLIWNSVNDPLFGWISDHTTTDTPDHKRGHPSLRRVRHIRYAGWLLGGAFLFAWFPWSTSSRPLAAIHFLLSLCFYDGALTYMEVNHSSLLADLSSNTQTRAWCNSAASIFSILGSFSSFFAHLLYSSTSAGPSISFRLFCVLTVALAIPAVELSVRVVGEWAWTHGPIAAAAATESEQEEQRSLIERTDATDASPSVSPPETVPESPSIRPVAAAGGVNVRVLNVADSSATPPPPSSDLPPASLTFALFLRQLLSHRNFSIFCCLRLLQVFLCTFEKNHLSSFLDILLSDVLSQGSRGLLISMSFILPHLLLLLTSAYQKELGGVYSIIQKLFTTKILAAVCMLTALVWGTHGGMTGLSESTLLPYLLLLYLCGSRVFTECVCRMFPLVVSNLVDEDRVIHLRPSSMAATLIGTSSLLAKPGESLAPMLGWQVLNTVAAEEQQDAATTMDSTSSTQHSDARKQALLYLLLSLPLVTVSLQLLLWSFFTLKGAYLQRITQRVKELEGHTLADSPDASPKDKQDASIVMQ